MKQKLKWIWPACALALTGLWIFFIIHRSLKPAVVSAEESKWMLTLMGIVPTQTADLLIRKTAHFLEFFILGGLLWTDARLLCMEAFFLPIGVGALTAITDEVIQTFVPGRAGRFLDVVIDTCGVIAACMILRCFLRQRQRKKRKEGDS